MPPPFFRNIVVISIFSEIFLVNKRFENIFEENIFGENIFGPPLLIAHSLLPYFKPLPLLTPLSGFFEVKCDKQ